MADVLNFPGPTLLDIPAETILQNALNANLVSVIVIGETSDGEIFHATSSGSIAELLLAIEIFKAEIMRQAVI